MKLKNLCYSTFYHSKAIHVALITRKTFFSIFFYLTIIINILINLNILIRISPYRDNTVQNSGAKVEVLCVKRVTRILISR